MSELSVQSLADRIRAGQSLLGEAQTHVVVAAERLREERDRLTALAGTSPGLQGAVTATEDSHRLSQPPFLALRAAVDDLDIYLGAIGTGAHVGSPSRTHPSKRPIAQPEPEPPEPAPVLDVPEAQDLAEALRGLDMSPTSTPTPLNGSWTASTPRNSTATTLPTPTRAPPRPSPEDPGRC